MPWWRRAKSLHGVITRSAPYAMALAMLQSKISLTPSWHAVSVLIIKTSSNLHEEKIARPIGVVIFM